MLNRRLSSVPSLAHPQPATPGTAGINALQQALDSDHENRALKNSVLRQDAVPDIVPRGLDQTVEGSRSCHMGGHGMSTACEFDALVPFTAISAFWRL